jgi:phosphomannomutase
MTIPLTAFRAYDIRGQVPNEVNPELAHAVGQALAQYLPPDIVAIEHDMRLDSEELAAALIDGLVRQGREVWDLGRITTDMSYWAVGYYKLAGGAMITASHNPAGDNGIKLTKIGVDPIGAKSGLDQIKSLIKKNSFKPAKLAGRVTHKHVLRDWIEHSLQLSGDEFAPLQVGMDTGNGMEAIVLPLLHELTPLRVHGLDLRLDGSFPHHVANPLIAGNTADLQQLVVGKKLDCGLAFDGDGDRVFAIDEKGSRVSAGELGALLVKHALQTQPAGTVLYSSPSSRIVGMEIDLMGGKAHRTPVGHSLIVPEMQRTHAVLGCEHSGHFYFGDNYGADSGLIAALTMLHILSVSNKKLSQLVRDLHNPYVAIDELNLPISDAEAVITKLKQNYYDAKLDMLDGLTVNYPDWWCNARASNTEPLLRLNLEAKTPELLKDKLAEIKKLLG